MVVSVYVATQKSIDLNLDSIYMPLQVGACGKQPIPVKGKDGVVPEYLRDDSSEFNISILNQYFCELTGLYWIWKNSSADIVGLCHYRRYFVSVAGLIYKKINHSKNTGFLSKEKILRFLNRKDIIVTQFWTNDSVLTQYANGHYKEDLLRVRNVLSRLYPDYLGDFDAVMRGKRYFACNMMIARKEIINKYCDWLFSILFAVMPLIPYQSYDQYQRRVLGFLGERLLSVWVLHNRLRVKVCPIIVTN